MRRPRAAGSLLAIGVVGALLVGCGGSDERASRPSDAAAPVSASSSGAAARHHLLSEVAELIVPATDGGWVAVLAELTEGSSVDRWVLASTAIEGPTSQEAIAAALDAAGSGSDASEQARAGRAAAIALADEWNAASVEVLGPGIVALAEQASTGLRQGEGGWLGALLNLAFLPGASGEAARRDLAALTGPTHCEALPAPEDPLPGPDGPLTVPLRLLAASGERCPDAAAVIDRVLEDPRWTAPIASASLADLFVLAPDARGDHGEAVALRLAGWLDPDDAEVVDLSVAVLLRRLAVAADVPFVLPDEVSFRLERIAARRGALPDRSTSPTTAFDLAIVRQLADAGLVDASLADAAGSAVDRQAAPLSDEMVELMVDGRAPQCADATAGEGEARRRSIGILLADAAHGVVRRHCDGGLSWDGVEAIIEDGPPSEAPVRAWGALLAACHLDPTVLTETATLSLALEGPFREEPIWLVGAAWAAAPDAACDAELAR